MGDVLLHLFCLRVCLRSTPATIRVALFDRNGSRFDQTKTLNVLANIWFTFWPNMVNILTNMVRVLTETVHFLTKMVLTEGGNIAHASDR